MIHTVANNAAWKKTIQSNKNVVTQFAQVWCGTSHRVKPHVENYARLFPDIHFNKVDVDEAYDIIEDFKPSSVPLFVAFKNQKEVARLSGTDPAQLKKIVEDLAKI